MPRAYSSELRHSVISAVQAGDPVSSVARANNNGPRTVLRWLKQFEDTENLNNNYSSCGQSSYLISEIIRVQ